nr:hypothetical protein [Tanacetum cinerariifolium]
MHKAFPLLVRKFPLPEGTSHCLKKNATARRKRLLSVLIILEDPDLSFQQVQDIDQQYPTIAKIPMLDTGKFKQWQFLMQQYLQHEHYALWEVIEFGDSYTAPESSPSTTTTSTDKSGRTITLTTEDMQKKKNDVKSRTTLLLSLPDEHQLRFSKHKTAKELWAAILKTFGGNEATKKAKKNLLKQHLAPEWLMHTIVWRNMSDLDTMSLDDLYNHLKVYEVEVQKKSKPNTHNMAFISSTKHRRGNDEVNTASVYTASSNVPTASANVATMDVKSTFLYGTIDEEVYVMQPLRFQDPEYPARVYKVEKAMYGLHQAPRAWYGTLSKYLLSNGFQRDKYMGDILKKFGYLDVRSSNTHMDKENPWGKDGTGKDVDHHLYRSMIRSLMYLTASRPDIMFAVRACARH